ncbi:hypothetical protein PBY51_024933 [Eleginops maclovinus]|uniref:Uncharacterized protein n=1 Tax=Eleginops maclovinus TaxID=56733 RepID=A0AAN8API1_ELEMC|nr:hypothetical protein PBY51_024933 [Eleginops maclovinus]
MKERPTESDRPAACPLPDAHKQRLQLSPKCAHLSGYSLSHCPEHLDLPAAACPFSSSFPLFLLRNREKVPRPWARRS